MRLCTLLLAGLLTTTFVAIAPTASAVDLCQTYGVCVPDTTPPGCTFDARALRYCGGQVYVCTARYMGGGDPLLVGNLIWRCEAVALALA